MNTDYNKRANHPWNDPKTEIRKIPALFAQATVAHRHTPQFGNFQYASGSRTKRASRPILQTESLIMTSTSRSKAWPADRRAKPGSTGEGDFYHIEVRPKTDFRTFRTQDVGRKGGIERVAGKRSTGSWETQKWLIGKELAHVEDGRLVPDSEHARKVLAELGSRPVHVGGDRFKAAPRPNVPESKKPTPAQANQQIKRKDTHHESQ